MKVYTELFVNKTYENNLIQFPNIYENLPLFVHKWHFCGSAVINCININDICFDAFVLQVFLVYTLLFML